MIEYGHKRLSINEIKLSADLLESKFFSCVNSTNAFE
jgi:hypothetical protein